MDHSALIETTQRLPPSPGVYLMKDARGALLYVGKAVNLKSRVRSYFTDDHQERPHIVPMMRRLRQIDWIATQTGQEALILEANLIRTHTPPYNVDLKDDKHYPYLKVTVREAFPRLLVVRRVESDGARYFGPYTDVAAMRRLVSFAKRIFRVRDCNKDLPLSRPVRPCINYSIGRCSGACAGLVTQDEYHQNVEQLLRFLRGRRNELLAEIEQRMQRSSENMKYEEAALCRDQISMIRDASSQQRVDLAVPDGSCDVYGIYEGERDVCLSVMHFREGLLVSTRNFLTGRPSWELSAGERDEAVVRYYMDSTLDQPSEILLPEDKGFDLGALQTWCDSRWESPVQVHAPQRGTKRALVELAEKNARLHLLQKAPYHDEDAVDDLQKALKLPSTPHVIEAFDISNLGSSFAVAGMVRFVDGAAHKAGYRRFRIRSVAGQDDFAMLMEAVTRRLTRLVAESKPLPDLLLIDGGKGQLSAVQEALRAFEQPPMAVSLAKQEELLYSPWVDGEVRLPQTHPARRLVERIRDEVHRYSLAYHRNLRGKQFRRSLLEDIPGVGPATSKALLRAFGSVKNLRGATVDEMAAVRGVSRMAAESVREALGAA